MKILAEKKKTLFLHGIRESSLKLRFFQCIGPAMWGWANTSDDDKT